MIDTWIVFGGWALQPQILAPMFGSGAVLIDTNSLMPYFVRDFALVKDWHNMLADRITAQIPDRPFGIAGWSTGSMLAYALAHRIKPACGVFISATPSFCRRPGFPHGQKSLVLKKMRELLAADPFNAVDEFYQQCGIASPEEKKMGLPYDKAVLTAGLHFLEQADLSPLKKLPFPTLFLHGKTDTIIPIAVGKYFCNKAGGIFIEFEGPHAFFANCQLQISKLLRKHIKCLSA
jgi:surfactin synthase thioesterase subunit